MKRSLLEFRRAFSTGLPLISEMDKRPLVSISNNSFYYYLLSLAHPDFQPHWQQKRTAFKQCLIISPPYWLNNVHTHFHSYDWGHNILELPHAARVIASDLYPNYPVKKPITWEMYLNIRQQALKFIHEIPNVQLINTTPLPIQQSSPGNYVLPTLSDKHLQLTTDTFFYNWWRQPAMHGLP
ncbi:MAG: hypothetical protein K2X50_10405, partial [Gammaproteobacteria bacterium]|nr:hypothetical protein [Gammaproteobacteria bacterium]